MSVIGKPGRNPGPGKTSIAGSLTRGKHGRSTSMKTSGGPNKDANKAIGRSRVNPGPGGQQRPPANLTGS